MSPDVSDYYTYKSRIAIQQSGNKDWPPYAFRMDFGNRLRDARNDAELTGDKLGALIGVSKQTIAHWEANRYEPKIVYLAKLSEVLGVSVDWLVTGKTIETLSPAAIKQGRFYEALSLEGRRRWETAKMLIREGVPDATVEKRMPVTAAPPSNMGSKERVSTEPEVVRPDTFMSEDRKHIAYSIPGTGKKKGAQRDQGSSNSDAEPPERGKHTSDPSAPRRARKA